MAAVSATAVSEVLMPGASGPLGVPGGLCAQLQPQPRVLQWGCWPCFPEHPPAFPPPLLGREVCQTQSMAREASSTPSWFSFGDCLWRCHRLTFRALLLGLQHPLRKSGMQGEIPCAGGGPGHVSGWQEGMQSQMQFSQGRPPSRSRHTLPHTSELF